MTLLFFKKKRIPRLFIGTIGVVQKPRLSDWSTRFYFTIIFCIRPHYLYIEIVSLGLLTHAIYFIHVHVSFIFITNGIKKPKLITHNKQTKKNALKILHYRMLIAPSEHLLRLTEVKNIVHNGYLYLFFQTGFLSVLNHFRGSFSHKLSPFPKF